MNKKIVVLGVSGSGKSFIGKRLADKFGCPFFDGDDYHSAENIEKMSQGMPLSDKDRMSWLESLNHLLRTNDSAVVACSGLKPKYRNILRQGLDEVLMIYLKGDFNTIWTRLEKRKGHYFQGRHMLKSQFDTLIEPHENEAIVVDISQDADSVFQQTLALIADYERHKNRL